MNKTIHIIICFNRLYCANLITTMRIAIENKQEQHMAILDGQLSIPKHLKGKKQLLNH